MKSYLSIHLLAALAAIAPSVVAVPRRPGGRRLSRPASTFGVSDVPDDCTFFDTPMSASEDCQYLASVWGITLEDFITWNPSVGPDCSEIQVGQEYCVERNWGLPLPPTTTTGAGSEPTETSGPEVPSPTQEGIVNSCVRWHQAVSGDTCIVITETFGGVFTTGEFIDWNPAVGADCTGLWLGYWYCVGVPDTPVTANPPPTTATNPSTTTTGNSVPSPTQEGIVVGCTDWYEAVSGDTCLVIAQKLGNQFSSSDFIEWNPAVGTTCTGLWLGYWYCVGVPSMPQPPVTTRTTTVPSPTTTGCAGAPAPTQPGAVCSCTRWHQVVSGDGCWDLQQTYSITATQFLRWNPQVGADCSTLWLGYYVCVSGP